MRPEEIRRLAVSDLTKETLQELIEHGEDLLVERKRKITEPEKFGAVVSSMANALGGWLLVGVDDDRTVVGVDLPEGLDLQSHLGDVLRKAVDPVPPFRAEVLVLSGDEVVALRVFEASAPVLVKGTGAVYTRDAGGKRPVPDHRDLLELARAGSQAEASARERPDESQLVRDALHFGQQLTKKVRIAVRASPLNVTPQLADWPISRAGAFEVEWAARGLAERLGAKQDEYSNPTEPFARGVVSRAYQFEPVPNPAQWMAIAAADSLGVFAACGAVGTYPHLALDYLRRDGIRPVLDGTVNLLGKAEAYGAAIFDLYLLTPDGQTYADQTRTPGPRIYCGSARLTIPATEDEVAALGRLWEREIARSAGIARWLDDE